MPTLDHDSHETWIIGQDKIWTLTAHAAISVEGAWGIYETGSGNAIRVLGDVEASGDDFGALRFKGSTSSVFIGKDAHLYASGADYGIYAEGAGSDIQNLGFIRSGYVGIQSALWCEIENSGTIRSIFAIDLGGPGSQIDNTGDILGKFAGISGYGGGSVIHNGIGAVISGGNAGIVLIGDGSVSIDNHGRITGLRAAIDMADLTGHISIRSTGKIEGDVLLGDNEDIFDIRGGSFDGVCYGGGGNDHFKVSSADVKIVELANGGDHDWLFSTVSIELADNIEDLQLLGSKDIDGTGNIWDNDLYGNSGDNALDGGVGKDRFHGGRGNDVLTGGFDSDIFFFAGNHAGVDRITDFEDSEDFLTIDGVESQQAFDALDIKQVGADTVINLGHGNKVIIENFLKSDLDYATDFT